ncbi:protein TIPIN homolog [Sitodiplosis mosellana]|uniref:protein TIPIN homolog n=1 Tax=Sitodiplosis mosellana TaxID=263140 RepID=UPI0024447AFD|nr:protein TIPIN homolog [Sitodiplosis mosellana]
MDIFGDDIDSFYHNDDELNENIREQNVIEEADEDNGEKDGDGKLDENSEPIKVEAKKRSVRRPQLRLNVERLKSDRGIHTVEDYFKDFKCRGKGHEREDLNAVMKRLEHWAHRLYPNYQFDDFVAQVEKLGRKKEIQTHMYRYRHGLLDDLNKNKGNEDEEVREEGENHMEGIEPIDEMDEIIDQQIQNYTMAPRTPAHERTFESIRSSMIATPRLRDQHPIEASTPIAKPVESAPVTKPALTSEQMAKIAENRRLAQERLRLKKLEAEKAAAAAAAAALNTENAENEEFT